jgi:hypothetical protein
MTTSATSGRDTAGVSLSTWARAVRAAEPQTYGEVVEELADAPTGPDGTAAARAVADAIDDPSGPLAEDADHEDAGTFPIVTVAGGVDA